MSSPAWAIENWNKPLASTPPVSTVYPIRLVATQDLSVVETKGQNVGPYVAISHTWGRHHLDACDRDHTAGACYRDTPGNEVKMREIQCAVKELGVEYFWMDNMCINQSDEQEKIDEIKKMGDYYKNARSCLAHLDDLTTKDDLLPKVYDEFKSFLDTAPAGAPSAVHMMFGASDPRTFMGSTLLINALVDSFWGTRVWTIQEALLNPVLDFIIPGFPHLVNARVIEHALYLKTISSTFALSSQRGFISQAMSHDSPFSLNANVFVPLGRQVINEGRSNIAQVILMRRKKHYVVAHLLDIVRTRQCTLPQDRIYGILGLLPYGSTVKIDYSVDLNTATRDLFKAALQYGDSSILYFTGKSRGMIPDIMHSSGSLVPRHTYPIERIGESITAMVVEHIGEIVEAIEVRGNLENATDADKFSLTLEALYQVLDMTREGRIPEEQASHIVCLSMPTDKEKTSFLAYSERTRDTPEEEAAMRGLSILYGECKIQLARVAAEGKADKWVGIASDEDILGGRVVSMGLTNWEDRIGMVVRPASGPLLCRIGATATIQKDEYPIQAILIPDEL